MTDSTRELFKADFIARIAPRGQGRVRGTARGKFVRFYKHPDDRAWEAEFALLAAWHGPLTAMSGLVHLRIIAAKKRPQRLRSKKAPEGYLYRDVKPDVDNVCKAVLDALNELWWEDDRQIAWLDARSAWAPKGEEGHLVIWVEEMIEDGEVEI